MWLRGRGWGTVAGLVLATVLLSVVNPALLVMVPLALLLLALPPLRPRRVAVGAVLAGIALAGAGAVQDPVWYLERGWPLIVGSWFLALVVLVPGPRFLARGLGAVAAAALSAAVVLGLSGGWSSVDWAFGQRFRVGASRALQIWGERVDGSTGEGLAEALQQAAALQGVVYPALLALGSLAGLALAWWLYRRVAEREGNPLGRLREFRFSDHLVWVALAGVLLVVLPLGDAAIRTGSNLLTFMGALYALRGLAVVVALAGSPGIGTVLLGGLAVVFLYPLVLAATLVVGLSDTWLDLRAARKGAAGPEA